MTGLENIIEIKKHRTPSDTNIYLLNIEYEIYIEELACSI
jgi:hypothetical protein